MHCDPCQNVFKGDLVFFSPKAHRQTANSLLVAARQQRQLCIRLWAHFSNDGQKNLLSLQMKPISQLA
jgi:hypothetical protein